MEKKISLTLKVWRQADANAPGGFETFHLKGIDTAMSFLEMLDVVNETIQKNGGDPLAFDHDCREGICGMCGAVVNGTAHGPEAATTLCQLHMRSFSDGDTIVVEPFRAKGFPVIKDLAVDRSAFDRVIEAGGYISVRTGAAPDAHTTPVAKPTADRAFDAAACIGCGACVAACPNASAMLFVSAKISHLGLLPQGQVQQNRRALKMVLQMDEEGFGNCSNEYLCEAACPKEIKIENIARMNRRFLGAAIKTGVAG